MKNTRGLVVILVVLVMALTPAWAGTIRDDRADSAYLALGAGYANVGRINVSTPSGNYIGSGTLIASNWVLTAGHVVDDVTAATFSIGGTVYTAESWRAHSKWNGDLLNGNDIALIKLATEIGGITPAERYTGSGEYLAVGTAVGYGMTGTGLTGAVTFDGQKRAGNNVIDAFYGKNPRKTPKIFLSDFDNPADAGDNAYGDATALEMEYLIAPGDSGGPVFIDVDGIPHLAGVNSFGASFDGNTDADYGDVSGHTRVSQFNNWIDDIIGGGGKGGKGGKGNGGGNGKGGGKPSLMIGLDGTPVANIIPEPASLSLLSLAGMAILKRRRHQ
jgi:hypothetical protein